MEDTTLDILETENQLVINEHNGGFIIEEAETDVLNIISDTTTLVIPSDSVNILSVGTQGPPGIQGPQGIPGSGIASLQDDPNPTLGGDLITDGYQFVGQIETEDFILDGGLL